MSQNGQHECPHIEDDQTIPSREARQPQLNCTICGVRCGQVGGQFGADEGGGGRDVDADNDFLKGEEGAGHGPISMAAPPSPVQSPTGRFDTRCADFVVYGDEFRYGSENVNMEYPFRAAAQSDILDRAGTPGSLTHCLYTSDEPSTMSSSGILTRRSDSPGPVFNGLGVWATGYYFSSPPLPLAPQWQLPAQPHFQHISVNGVVEDEYPDSITSADLDYEEGGAESED